MLDILILRLASPMISLGGAIVDNYGIIREFPAASMLTGLLGNALGYDHSDTEKLQLLQEKLRFAVRCDSQGSKIVDYQTVDLDQEFMKDTGWTTLNKSENRRGGPASKGTHQRYRDYWADAIYTIALTLEMSTVTLTIDYLEQALLTPARPLFIGRKCCIPSEQILYSKVQAPSIIEALYTIPLAKQSMQLNRNQKLRLWCPEEEVLLGEKRIIPITDEKDWKNQIHCGRRIIQEGRMELTGCTYE
jgi:CRISPR system Cascade subunit CasD